MLKKLRFILLSILFIIFPISILKPQNFRFGVFADPAVCWFSSNTNETINEGARSGFSFGLTFNRYFSDKYSFSSGISILNTGGRIYNTDIVNMSLNNLEVEVAPEEPVIYKTQYINIPVGLKFESNQIGYLKFFTDVGIDPRFMVSGKVDIPSAGVKGEAAKEELNPFNLAYHIMGGIEYSLGSTTEMVFGIGFDHCFLDVTKDINLQPEDKVSNNIIKFRIGVNF